MCDFCGGRVHKPLPAQFMDRSGIHLELTIDKRGYLLVNVTQDFKEGSRWDSTGCPISYCPICGRSLLAN